MRNDVVVNNYQSELTVDECMEITGGGEITNYFRCVGATLTSGGGGTRTLVLGVGLFGLARMLGVAVGCSSL